jgi:hypothetical protein
VKNEKIKTDAVRGLEKIRKKEETRVSFFSMVFPKKNILGENKNVKYNSMLF